MTWNRVWVAMVALLLLPLVAADLNSNVELYYSFNNGSVNTTHVLDKAQGHHGIRVNTTVTEDGVENESLGLHRGFVVVPAFDMGDNFTMCTAFRLKEFEHALVSTYSKNFSRQGGAFEFFINTYDPEDPQLGVILDNDESFIEVDAHDETLRAETHWHYVCATYDGGTTPESLRLYHDGVRVAYSTLSNGTYPGGHNTSFDLILGAGNPDGTFEAQDTDFDEFLIYKNRVLDESEMTALYARYVAGETYPFT